MSASVAVTAQRKGLAMTITLAIQMLSGMMMFGNKMSHLAGGSDSQQTLGTNQGIMCDTT